MRAAATNGAKVQPEQRLFAYLSQVANEASGKISPAARIRLVDSLRTTIEQERARRGYDLATLDGILRRLGDPVTLVDTEVQRDPDYQARLSARLIRATDGPQVPITDDLAELLAPQSTAGGGAAVVARPGGDGPELCLDPDPFVTERSVETVGALASAPAPAPPSAPATATTMTMILPDFSEVGDPGAPVSPAMARVRAAWLHGPKARPWEALAIAVFLVGAVLGQWVVLLLAGLVACTSRYYTSIEKWVLVVGVPVATGLVYAFGFWLHQRGFWGGTAVNTSDLLSGAASFFGTLPRIAALFAALFLSWRLARGITRQM